MSKLARKSLSVVLACLLLTNPCCAWGPEGHRIVARIAYDNLTPKAKARLNALLRQDEDLVHMVGPERLEAAATWPDEIKSDDDFPVEIFPDLDVHNAKESKPLHFCDLGGDKYDPGRDCKDHKSGKPNQCIIRAIEMCRATLKDQNASASDRIEAVKYLTHFVGDIHQPLHAGRASDSGGNDIKVDAFLSIRPKKHHDITLHAVWDGNIIREADRDPERYGRNLSETITPEEKDAWGKTIDPISWLEDSHQLAMQLAYVDENGKEIKSGDKITRDYVDRATPKVEEQLKKAGVRLAAMLNELLG